MSKKVNTREFQDVEFVLNITDDGWRDTQIQTVILCDIRRELKKLNAVFHCPNFLEVPRTLRSIRYNTTKPKKRKKKVT